MQQNHLNFLACPSCQGELSVLDIELLEGNRIREGRLTCTTCATIFPIHNFIPRFVPIENYASGFGLQWNTHKNTQYDSYTGLPISEQRFFKETEWPSDMTGQTILEAGSGSSHFTEHAIRSGAFDYSYAVEANYNHNSHNEIVGQGQKPINSDNTRHE